MGLITRKPIDGFEHVIKINADLPVGLQPLGWPMPTNGSFLDPTEPSVVPDLGYLGVTDEYLADLAASEFPLICPRDQDGAAGEDGSFAAGDLYTLLSPGTNFVAQQIQVGDVTAVLDSKRESARVRGIYVVTVVNANSVTLRTRGPRVGFGLPPGKPGGETGLHFRVITARPQIALSAAKFVRRYRLGTAQILSPTDFVPAVAYDTLASLYTLASRQASLLNGTSAPPSSAKDSLYAKAKNFEAERDNEIKILDSTYRTEPDLMPLVAKRMRLNSDARRRPPGWNGSQFGWYWTDDDSGY